MLTRSFSDLITELREKKQRILDSGGQKAIEKQHQQGKMAARERIEYLIDKGTFVEINMFAHHKVRDYGLDGRFLPGDGVITGFGEINGRQVYLVVEDFTVLGGTFGEAHGRKIAKTIQEAGNAGVPLLMLVDSAGARVQEPLPMMSVYPEVFRLHSIYSGVIPQICGMMGPCAGGQAYSPILTDFLFMVDKVSYMYIAGPDLVKTVTGEDVSNEELGGPYIHSYLSGCCDRVSKDDRACLDELKILLSYLPQNNRQRTPEVSMGDDPERRTDILTEIVPTNMRKSYNMYSVIKEIVDNGDFFEIKPEFAPNIITCFTRMDGNTVGLIANQPLVKAGTIDIDAADKYARFIRFCDAFSIPIVTLIDTPAYLVGTDQERKGIIRHGAKILHAYSVATVPKISILLRKGYAGAFIAMGCRGLGADFVFAWPTAELCLMGEAGAVSILYRKELAKMEDVQAFRLENEKEYRERFINPYEVASYQHLDLISDIIEPCETRQKIIKALRITKNKNETLPWKKLGNTPL